MISSLDELVLECVDEGARAQIGEAVRCYQGGAYRAAIVAAYVAVCFDLIQKMKFLAAAGDPSAITAVGELHRLQEQQDRSDPQAITGLLRFERSLLEKFRDDFGFFGSNEFEELERLKSDRNRCAHPTFLKNSAPYNPSAELARLHIRNALALVLSQHPRQGRAALASLEAIVLSSYFPKTHPDAVERLKGTELLRARPGLIDGFVDELCFGWPRPGHPYHGKLAAAQAVGATVEIHRVHALPRLIRNINKLINGSDATGVRFGCILALRVPEAGDSVDDSGKAVLRTWLIDPKPSTRGNAIARALKIQWLRQTATDAIPTLTASEISEITHSFPPEIVSRAAQIYGSVKSWDEANSVASSCILPLADRLSEEDLSLILARAASGDADLQGSHGFKQLIRSISEQSAERKALVDQLLDNNDLSEYQIAEVSEDGVA